MKSITLDVSELEKLGKPGELALLLLQEYAEKLDAQHNNLLRNFATDNVLIVEKSSVSRSKLSKLPFEVIEYKKGTTPPRFITRER
jgi:hypothetical protein